MILQILSPKAEGKNLLSQTHLQLQCESVMGLLGESLLWERVIAEGWHRIHSSEGGKAWRRDFQPSG